MSDDLIRRSDAIKAMAKAIGRILYDAEAVSQHVMNSIPAVEPNLILPERMERGDCYEVGETIVVMNHDDYYDLLCKSMKNEPKQGKWTVKNGELAFWDVCSVCGKMVMHKAPFYNYCPNCGAKMRRSTDDE